MQKRSVQLLGPVEARVPEQEQPQFEVRWQPGLRRCVECEFLGRLSSSTRKCEPNANRRHRTSLRVHFQLAVLRGSVSLSPSAQKQSAKGMRYDRAERQGLQVPFHTRLKAEWRC